MGVAVRDKLPDAGVVANRYIFYLDSKTDVGRQAAGAPDFVGSLAASQRRSALQLEVWHVVHGEDDRGRREEGRHRQVQGLGTRAAGTGKVDH